MKLFSCTCKLSNIRYDVTYPTNWSPKNYWYFSFSVAVTALFRFNRRNKELLQAKIRCIPVITTYGNRHNIRKAHNKELKDHVLHFQEAGVCLEKYTIFFVSENRKSTFINGMKVNSVYKKSSDEFTKDAFFFVFQIPLSCHRKWKGEIAGLA